jgi:hypothetical protein
MVGLLDALGEETAVIAGHDFPSGSLPRRHRPQRALPAARHREAEHAQTEHEVFYQIYFQTPGVAEAELQRDVRSTMRRMAYSGSGDAASRLGAGRTPGGEIAMVKRGGGFLDHTIDPLSLPAWISEADIDFYTKEFSRTGFRGGLNWYRNIDRNWELLASWASCRRHRPRALRGRRSRPGRPVPRNGSAHPEPVEVRAEAAAYDHAAGLRPLDPAGARARGQRRHARVLEGAVRERGTGRHRCRGCFLALTFGTNYGRLRRAESGLRSDEPMPLNANIAP